MNYQNPNAFNQNTAQEMSMFGGQQMSTLPTVSVQSQYRCEIVGLTLQETGTYNDQFARPYQTDVRTENVANRIYDVVERANFSPTSGAFNNVVADVLTVNPRVSANDFIAIPNGWGQNRCRFFLEVRETSLGLGGETYFTFVQGFSDYFGVNAATSSIDPNIRLFPNTFFRFQEYTEQTMNGPRKSYRVVSSGQVLNGILTINDEIGSSVNFLRPCDILAGVQVAYDQSLVSSDVLDLRSMNPSGFNTVYSSFSNNSPSEYLSRLVTPLSRGSLTVGFGPGHSTFVDTAVTNAGAMEPDVHSSIFMETMVARLGPMSSSCFTMTDLAQLDPTVGQRTSYRPISNEYLGRLPQRGLTENWDMPKFETVIAAKIMNTLPGLMWEHFIGMVSIAMSNEFGPAIPQVDNIRLITKAAPRGMFERFVAMLTERLATDISQNNNIKFSININASVLGDVMMQVSVNGGAPIPYQAPAFGNGILNPTYARGDASKTSLVESITHVASQIDTIARNHHAGTTGIFSVI